ncbi:hypothetical protein LINPERPRIM_LOCUS27347, partial [Linum perenne]
MVEIEWNDMRPKISTFVTLERTAKKDLTRLELLARSKVMDR